jgi:hypothetical protein|tara:strand:+ start:1565 stop:1981 length:417 start_codon:yes stop_codon:yes gene_type:complete
MKKVTLKFPHSGRRITQFVTEIIDELDNDQTAFANCFNGLKAMTDDGDIWFRNYEHDGANINCVFILDSDESVTKFAPHRTYLESATGHIETTVEDITFDEFAAFAAERDETHVQHARKAELNPEGAAAANGEGDNIM